MSSYELTRDIGVKYEYSNVGEGLLGHILSRRAGVDYETLVRQRICEPLGMDSTRIMLTPALKLRLATGHNQALEPVSNWDFPTLAGAGALRSSANDLLAFLAAVLGYNKTDLAPAMSNMLSVRRPTGIPGLDISIGWHISKHNGYAIVWHNGATGGYRSFVGYDPQNRVGIVVLSNAQTALGIDDIGQHLLDPSLPLKALPKQHTEISVDPKLFAGYVGQYQLGPNFILDVTQQGSHLFVQATGQSKLEVVPEGERDYFYRIVDAQITFEPDADGKSVALVLHQNGADRRAVRIR